MASIRRACSIPDAWSPAFDWAQLRAGGGSAMNLISIDDVYAALEDLRARRPLVHNITNYVAMTVTANVLLALGASPAMVHAAEEVEDFVSISDALAVNIGTLSPSWVKAMRAAVARAK